MKPFGTKFIIERQVVERELRDKYIAALEGLKKPNGSVNWNDAIDLAIKTIRDL